MLRFAAFTHTYRKARNDGCVALLYLRVCRAGFYRAVYNETLLHAETSSTGNSGFVFVLRMRLMLKLRYSLV
jgi:hypothetical protein